MPKEITIPYNPHPKQALFHRNRYKYFGRLVSGGTGSGKTRGGAYECTLWIFENPGCVGYAFEPTFKMVKRNLIPTLESLFGAPLESSPLIKDYNRADSNLTFINGSKLWMIGLEDPTSAEGPNVDFIWADEPRWMRHLDVGWQVWTRRLRGSVPQAQRANTWLMNDPGIWLTTTPDMPGSVLFNLFENPKTKVPNSRVFRWTIDDNPYLSEVYKQNVKQTHTGGLYEQFVLGKFAAVALGSFSFDYTVHVLEETPQFLKEIVFGMDFGWTNPSAIVAVGFDGDDRAYVLDEFYQARTHVETLIQELKEMMQHYGESTIICDRSEPRTIEQMRQANVSVRADESKWEDGIREIGGRLKVADDGRPRLFISSKCVNLVSELQIYDAEKKENDHAVDALRYALCSRTSGEMQVFSGKVQYR